jgi:hypothetical protein
MSWFKKKKKEVDFSKELPDLKARVGESQGLPSTPRIKGQTNKFPSYESELSNIKEVIDRPIRQPAPSPIIEIPKRKPMLPLRDTLNQIQPKPQSPTPQPQGSGKSIFVKLDNYKAAREHMERVKSLTKDAEKLLTELNKTRDAEDRELETWKGDIEKIKDSLVMIDRKLFEG